jgi:hypothetical protein
LENSYSYSIEIECIYRWNRNNFVFIESLY